MTIKMHAALLMAALPALAFAAGSGRLAPPAAGDMVPTRLVAAKAIDLPGSTDRTPAHYAWRLDGGAALEPAGPFVASSREFYAEVDADTLAKGYGFQATAPGAVVRISPLDGNAKSAVDAARLQVRHGGRALSTEAAIDRVATAEQLKAAGADFAAGTLAFRLRPELGAGAFELALADARGSYLVHVYEPGSPVEARLAASRDTLLPGVTAEVSLVVEAGAAKAPMVASRGALVAPDGRVFDLDFARDGEGLAKARVELPEASAAGGLWEVHAFAAVEHEGVRVLRDVKTAIAVAAPTAHLVGRFSAAHDAGGLEFVLPVTAAAPGRYELRGVLYGTDAAGRSVPLAVAHAARWLEAGEAPVALRFGRDMLVGAKAPFELREVTLGDQSRVAVLERRALAARIEAPEAARAEDLDRRQDR